MRDILSKIHKISGMLALLIIITFFILSIYGEINGNHNVILTIKTYILYTVPLMVLLMPTCAIAGKAMVNLRL